MGNVNKIYRPLLNRIQTHSASDHRDRWIKQTGHSSLYHYNILQLSTDSWPFASVPYWNSTTWGPRSECNRTTQTCLRVVTGRYERSANISLKRQTKLNILENKRQFSCGLYQLSIGVKEQRADCRKLQNLELSSWHSHLNNSHYCGDITSSMRWSIHAARKGQTRNEYRIYPDNLGNGAMYARIMCDVK